MTTAIRIILVDDHSIIRIGLKQILGRSPDLDVVGDAGNCEAAVALAKELLPEIALVDVNLPDVDGLETALRIGAVSPATRVALLSGAFSDRILKRGVAIGI